MTYHSFSKTNKRFSLFLNSFLALLSVGKCWEFKHFLCFNLENKGLSAVVSMGDLREYGGRVIMGALVLRNSFFFYYKNVNKHSPFLFFSLLIFCCLFLNTATILIMAKKSTQHMKMGD